MKNKKGFTIIELLTVIIILSLIVTIAAMSMSKNRKVVNEKEKIALRQTIIAAFENYSIDHNDSLYEQVFVSDLNFAKELSYNNKKCDLGNSNIIRKRKNVDYIYYSEGFEDLSFEIQDQFRNKISSSNEEIFCVQFYCNEELIINDYRNSLTTEVLLNEENQIIAQIKVNYCMTMIN